MLRIRHVDPQGVDAMALLREASADARALYPESFAASDPSPTNGPLPARGVYVVAYVDGQPLACGALRPVDASVAELRRMYVHRDHRRQGLASAVLAHLLGEARRLGYSRLVLETGHRQLPAMRLYESHGFRRTAPFGDHIDDPTSVCYARSIDEDSHADFKGSAPLRHARRECGQGRKGAGQETRRAEGEDRPLAGRRGEEAGG
jgi:GNAT superfamily N-acetyltransferase